jgi:hypothetical protein
MALNVEMATAQDELIVYLHSYLVGIGALYEPRAIQPCTDFAYRRIDHAVESHRNAL